MIVNKDRVVVLHYFRFNMTGEMLEMSEVDGIGMASHKTPAGAKLETGLIFFHLSGILG